MGLLYKITAYSMDILISATTENSF